MTKRDRLDAANTLILTISNCGRRFFWSSRYNSVSQFKFGSNMGYDHNRLYYHDKSSNKLLPCSHYWSTNWKVNFTQGGGLFSVVQDLAKFIRTGEQLMPGHFGPWTAHYCRGDLWGYGEDMEIVRKTAAELGIIDGCAMLNRIQAVTAHNETEQAKKDMAA